MAESVSAHMLLPGDLSYISPLARRSGQELAWVSRDASQPDIRPASVVSSPGGHQQTAANPQARKLDTHARRPVD